MRLIVVKALPPAPHTLLLSTIRLNEYEREIDRASSLVVCEDGDKLNKASLSQLQRVVPILVRRYHAVRVEKEKMTQRVHVMTHELENYNSKFAIQ